MCVASHRGALTWPASASALFTSPATAELARLAASIPSVDQNAVFAIDEVAYAAAAGLIGPIAGALIGAHGAQTGWRIVCAIMAGLWSVAWVLWAVVMRPRRIQIDGGERSIASNVEQ